MSELSVKGQESKGVPDSHDQPPRYYPSQYCLSQPGIDILTSVIETEHTRRVLIQRLEDIEKGIDKLLQKEKKIPEESSFLKKA
jgi:hypothetical protein